MNTMKKIGMLVSLIVFCATASSLQAAVLLDQPDFTGGIDPLVWDTSGYVTTDGGFARVYSPTTVEWTFSKLATKNAYTVGAGLIIDFSLLYSGSEPGQAGYRPLFQIRDDAANVFVEVRREFGAGATTAPFNVYVRQSGALTLVKTTESYAIAAEYHYQVVYDGSNAAFLLTGGAIDDVSWTSSIDAASQIKLRAQTTCPGYWPGTAIWTKQLKIEEVPEPATMVLLGLGGVGLLIRRRRRA